jgi:pilus assembly protein CpaF
VNDVAGVGQLGALLQDPQVTDVLVNGVQVWVDRGDGLVRAPITMSSGDQVRRLAQRLAAACGRRLDDGMPYVDARLSDGSRLHAVLPPIATTGPYLSLRTFRLRALPLAELVSAELAELLAAIVEARFSFLIAGGTGSGKTTLLNAMLGAVSPRERIVLVEDAAELNPAHPHVVGLQSRASNVEGLGMIGLPDLVRQALRMRPDRLVVGECRGAELADLLSALNTGHDGGASTIHANCSADVPTRLEALGLLGGVPLVALRAQIAAAFHVVLQLRRGPARRELAEVSTLVRSGSQGVVVTSPIWSHQGGLGPAAQHFARSLAARGVAVPGWFRP